MEEHNCYICDSTDFARRFAGRNLCNKHWTLILTSRPEMPISWIKEQPKNIPVSKDIDSKQLRQAIDIISENAIEGVNLKQKLNEELKTTDIQKSVINPLIKYNILRTSHQGIVFVHNTDELTNIQG